VLITSAIGGKWKEKPSIDPLIAKSEQKEVKRSKNKRGALLSKTEAKSSHPLGLSNWQKNELQKLSAQELRKAWHGFLKEAFELKTQVMIKQKVQRN
jgi:hypothetical protein